MDWTTTPSDTDVSPDPTLILASASPRRRELLATLQLPFSVMPAHIDEGHHAAERPESYVARLARTKAEQLADRFPSTWVLGADTVVVLDQHILGKPADAAAARAMLGRLSGREHTVMTGVAVVHRGRSMTQGDVVSTRVRFRTLRAADIEAYLATGEPFDKAGAYAVQGVGGQFVVALEGCYNNVVGLPLERTLALLRLAGYDVGA